MFNPRPLETSPEVPFITRFSIFDIRYFVNNQMYLSFFYNKPVSEKYNYLFKSEKDSIDLGSWITSRLV